MIEIKDQSLQVFLHELASKAATPGGGSAAAVMGAMSAALTSMVCNLTLGKPKYAVVQADMQALLQQSEALRSNLTGMIEADVEVFGRVMAAYALPKDSEAEKNARSAAIQAALKAATQVSLDCAGACAEAIKLSREAAEKGNLNVVSDAGAAVMAGYGALKSAALNVYINAAGIKDREFAEVKLAELETVLNGSEAAVEDIYRTVKAKL
ncbi:MAG: methenyltetrahydrofolate cyclohydrolase [Gammaproteobacteria bacterium]